MHYSLGRKIHQVVTVVECFHLYVGREYALVEVSDFFLDPSQYFFGVFTFAHHDDTLHHVVVVVEPHLTDPGHGALAHVGNVFDQNGIAACVIDDDIFNVLRGIQQPDPTHHVRLTILFNNIAADVNIALVDCLMYLQRGNVVLRQAVRVYAHLVGFFLSTESHDVGYAWDGPKLTVDCPGLDREQVAGISFRTFQNVAKNFTRWAVGRLHVGLHFVG